MIIQYLEYLREMSRKIIQTSGLENVLLGSRSKYYLDRKSENSPEGQRHLEGIHEYLNKEQNQRLFCGAGLIIGSFKRRGEIKKIAGPLIYCLADSVHEDQSITVELDEYSISLNHDLITAILDIDDVSDEELEDIRQLSAVAPVFQNISEGFIKGIKQGKGVDIFYNVQSLLRVFEKIREGSVEFLSLSQEEHFAKNKLSSYFLEPTRLFFFPEFFYFVGPFPNQLSTYEALSRLIDEVS